VEPAEVAQIESILPLYRGDLLEGIYDEWTLIERERLHTMYINALIHLMDYYAYHNAYDKSLHFAKAILADDPLREDIHRMAMRLYQSMGQRAMAVQQYRICTSVLKRELDITPMEETEQLHRQMLTISSLPQRVAPEAASVLAYPDLQIQKIVRSLDQAHLHLKEAAQLLATLVPANKQLLE
jgi:DNA-binding SARP family transcriptional activator